MSSGGYDSAHGVSSSSACEDFFMGSAPPKYACDSSMVEIFVLLRELPVVVLSGSGDGDHRTISMA